MEGNLTGLSAAEKEKKGLDHVDAAPPLDSLSATGKPLRDVVPTGHECSTTSTTTTTTATETKTKDARGVGLSRHRCLKRKASAGLSGGKTSRLFRPFKRARLSFRQSLWYDLPADWRKLVCDWLSPVDLISLGRTSKEHHRMTRPLVKPTFQRTLRLYLRDYYLTEEELGLGHHDEYDNVSIPQVILSGSIVLQALLGERWPMSDVDLFCDKNAIESLRSHLAEHKVILQSRVHDVRYGDARLRTLLSSVHMYCPLAGVVDRPRETAPRFNREAPLPPFDYQKALEWGQHLAAEGFKMERPEPSMAWDDTLNGRLQVITTYDIRKVVEEFDLECVQNVWDGSTLTIKDPTGLIHRTTHMTKHALSSIQKYNNIRAAGSRFYEDRDIRYAIENNARALARRYDRYSSAPRSFRVLNVPLEGIPSCFP